MVLPEGFAVPPLELLVPLLCAFAVALALVWVTAPPVTDLTVLSFTPWMMLGSTLYVLYQVAAIPDAIAPLFGAPVVYVTTATVAGLVWVAGRALERARPELSAEVVLGVVGAGCFVAAAGYALETGRETGTLEAFWPALSVVLAAALTAAAWLGTRRWASETATLVGTTGVLVVFGHALDGVSTAVGYSVLEASENVPASRLILAAGEALPTAEYIGASWLFVAVKVALALAVVGLFREYVRDAPRQARLLLAFIAAVGLGPGVHNVLLFTIA
ncbi:DUF63 family protein [Halostagnicola kamekurae]|uniref:Uncharacterized membrane protein n=1 Tax=Halostagnicola kamekurae TaxID=619731 RepID=A0A1I6RUH9_9EURY|nr:DUF63 family protein [Halostagnicola kamekurae]SFS68250.1 Uncharacterized membrane protein [Halostagnicola kamekurae]